MVNAISGTYGYNMYTLVDLENGSLKVAYAHQLNDVDYAILSEFEEDINLPEDTPDEVNLENTGQDVVLVDLSNHIDNVQPRKDLQPRKEESGVKRRFKDTSDERLDELANKRTSHNTNAQTHWAVGTFKGKQIISIQILPSCSTSWRITIVECFLNLLSNQA